MEPFKELTQAEVAEPLFEEGFTILADHDPDRLTETNSSIASRLADEASAEVGKILLNRIFGAPQGTEDSVKPFPPLQAEENNKGADSPLSHSSFLKYPFTEDSLVEPGIVLGLPFSLKNAMTQGHVPITLINATDEAVYVLASGKMKKLKQISSPLILEGVRKRNESAVQLTFKGKKKVRYADIAWTEGDISVTSGCTINLPPMIEGVIYLVEPEILLQFIKREDFVAAGLYGSQFNKKNKKLKLRFRFYLSAITRTPYDFWDTTMQDITEQLFDDTEDENGKEKQLDVSVSDTSLDNS